MDPYEFKDQTTVIKIKRRYSRNGMQQAVCVIKTTAKRQLKVSLTKVMETHMAYHRVKYPFLTKQQIKGHTLKYLGLPNFMGDVPRTPGRGKNKASMSRLSVNSLAMFNYSKLLRQFVGNFQLRQNVGHSISEKTITTTTTDTSVAVQSLDEYEDSLSEYKADCSETHISEVSSDDEWQPASKKPRRLSKKGHTSTSNYPHDYELFNDLSSTGRGSRVIHNGKASTPKREEKPTTNQPRSSSRMKPTKNKDEISKMLTTSDFSTSSASEEESDQKIVEKKKSRPKTIKPSSTLVNKPKPVLEKNKLSETSLNHTTVHRKEITLKTTNLEKNVPKAKKKQGTTRAVSKTEELKSKALASSEDAGVFTEFLPCENTTPLEQENNSFPSMSNLFDSLLQEDSTDALEVTEQVNCIRKPGKIDISNPAEDFTITLEFYPHDTVKDLMLSSCSETSTSDFESLSDYDEIGKDNSGNEQVSNNKSEPDELVEDTSIKNQPISGNGLVGNEIVDEDEHKSVKHAEDKSIHKQVPAVEPELHVVLEYKSKKDKILDSAIKLAEDSNISKIMEADVSSESSHVCEILESSTTDIQNTELHENPISKEHIIEVLNSKEVNSDNNALNIENHRSVEKETLVTKKLNKKKVLKVAVDKCSEPKVVLQEITDNPPAKATKKCSLGMKIIPTLDNDPPEHQTINKDYENTFQTHEVENKIPEQVLDTSLEDVSENNSEQNIKLRKRKVSIGVKLVTSEREDNDNEQEVRSGNESSPDIIPGTPKSCTSEDSIETRLKDLQKQLDAAGTPDTINSTDSSTIQISITPRTAQIVENSEEEEKEEMQGDNEEGNSSDDEMESLFSKKTNKSYSKMPETPRSCRSIATVDSLAFNRHKTYQKSRAVRAPLNLPHINLATKVSKFLKGLEGSGNSQESYLSTSTDLNTSVEQSDQESASEVEQRKSQYATSECSVRSLLANLFDPIDKTGSRANSLAGTPLMDSVSSSPHLPTVMQPPATKCKLSTKKK